MTHLVSFSEPQDSHSRNGFQVIRDEKDKCFSGEDQPVPPMFEKDSTSQELNPLGDTQDTQNEKGELSLEERINAILPFPQPPKNSIEASVMETTLSEHGLSLSDIPGYSKEDTPSLQKLLGSTPDYPPLPQ